MRDLVVDAGVPLAVRDYGGTGQGILLLHGLGRTMIDWSIIGPLLTASGRVVAFDLRGHGKSGDGAWTWSAALLDIERVASTLELQKPALVGHSLGGMLAVMWAAAHPGSRAVNIDGHGHRALSQYAGIDPQEAARRAAEADQRVQASLRALAGPLPPQLLGALYAQQKVLAGQLGAPESMFIESIERSLYRVDGDTYLRPSPTGLGAEILAAAEAFDMFSLYPRAAGPILLLAGTDPDPGADQELMAAYRTGLRLDLERRSAGWPNVTVEFAGGGHGFLFERPHALAERILAFLAD